jgi:hypothetical protein
MKLCEPELNNTHQRAAFHGPFRKFLAGLLTYWCTAIPAYPQDFGAKLVIFDVPGSQRTISVSINLSKSVTGYYYDGVANRGFVRDGRTGTITTFQAGGQGVYTFPASINDVGVIAGYTNQTDGYVHSFVRDAQGAITTFDPPGPLYGSEAMSINGDGTITGLYQDANGVHGYLRDTQGAFTSFDVPGVNHTYGVGIDSSGNVAGYSIDANGFAHGFVRDAQGNISAFDPPGSLNTYPTSIANGAITGQYSSDGTIYHGFVRSAQGVIATFDVAGSSRTFGWAINNSRWSAGWYVDSIGTHALLRGPTGSITTFDVPGSTYTEFRGLNAQRVPTGFYQDANGVFHGFLGTP